MKHFYIIREHDGMTMAVIHGYWFAKALKELYEKQFTEQKFYISYQKPFGSKLKPLTNNRNERNTNPSTKRGKKSN